MPQLNSVVGRDWGEPPPGSLIFRLHPGSTRTSKVVGLPDSLKRLVRGPLQLIWDRLPARRSVLVRCSVDASRGRIVVESLSPRVPELNPVPSLELLEGAGARQRLARGILGARTVILVAQKKIKRKRNHFVGTC